MKAEISPLRLLGKAVCLFAIVNISYAFLNPQISEVSAYNVLFPGRTRLPFGDSSFSVMVDSVDPMFASHLISLPKTPDEYRVVLIGDSAVWGEKLPAHEIISEQWNRLNVPCNSKTIRVYDLGYPHPSVIKDLIILDKAMEYKPDLLIWFITLNTLNPRPGNLFLEANSERTLNILNAYDLLLGHDEVLNQPGFYERTLIGQRSNLARVIKLQLLGFVWAATDMDNDTEMEEPLDFDVGDNPHYREMDSSSDVTNLLLFDALAAGIDIAAPVPVLLVNEPIFITKEEYAAVRYNDMYPRWAYDQFRTAVTGQAQIRGWNYLDLWNTVPPEYFLDASVHRSAVGQQLLIEQINPTVQSIACNAKP